MARVRVAAASGGFSGRLANLVYVVRNGEVFVQPRPSSRPRTSPAEIGAQQRLRLANVLWAQLADADRAAWQAYAETQSSESPATGIRRTPRADNLFRGLAAKYLQIHGGATAPSTPPAGLFLGDGIAVTVGVAAGEIVFTASGPNSAGIATELLFQRLGRRYYTPQSRNYRSLGFVAFSPGELSASVPADPGAYGCAVRFVRVATGQESAVMGLGVVEL